MRASQSGLQPYDYHWNCPRTAVPSPAEVPFDRTAALAAWRRCTRAVSPQKDWTACRVPIAMSEAEANFWLHALTEPQVTQRPLRAGNRSSDFDETYHTARERASAYLAEFDLSADYRASVVPRLADYHLAVEELASVVARLLGAEALFELILDRDNAPARAVMAENDRRQRAYFERRRSGSTSFIVSFNNGAFRRDRTAPIEFQPEAPPFAPGSLLERTADTPGACDRVLSGLARGFAQRVAPYLADDVAAQLAHRLRTCYVAAEDFCAAAIKREPLWGLITVMPPLLLAAALHVHEYTAAALETLEELPRFTPQDVDLVAFGLADAQTAEQFLRRHRVTWTRPQAVAEWLARTGDDGVDYACEQVVAHAADDDALAYLDALGRVATPRIAAAMLRLTERPPLYVAARSWLEAHASLAEPVLRERIDDRGVSGETAREILARFARRRPPLTGAKGSTT